MEENKKEEILNEENIEVLEESKETPKKEKKSNKKKDLELEKLKLENASLNDKLLRLAAEIQNINKRHQLEMMELYKYEGEDFIKKILPVLDNFERAVSMDNDNLEDEVSKFLNGFKLIYDNLINSLKEKNVVEIDALDKPFDPNSMEAVLTEHIDGKEAGIVTCVMQKGYMYNDKVLRPAMVKVNE